MFVLVAWEHIQAEVMIVLGGRFHARGIYL